MAKCHFSTYQLSRLSCTGYLEVGLPSSGEKRGTWDRQLVIGFSLPLVCHARNANQDPGKESDSSYQNPGRGFAGNRAERSTKQTNLKVKTDRRSAPRTRI